VCTPVGLGQIQKWAIPIIIHTPPVEEPCINLGISRGGGALTLEFPGERCINFKFPGEGYINLGISRGEGTLTLKFPGKGAFRLWNSKGRSNSHMEFLREG
jgi:hypothetical protein